jgi:hypothetical protein
MEQEIDVVQEEAVGFENKESDLLHKLVDMLIEPPANGQQSFNESIKPETLESYDPELS